MLTTVILGLVVLALVLIILEDIVHVNKAKTTLFLNLMLDIGVYFPFRRGCQ
jgi:hypothetical protein